ncbi:MAG TPA: hypothetical protein VLB44_04870 [Kofleriaceae bacterium]|nr:hypothetical protein [Kofleriaceae bacterium]
MRILIVAALLVPTLAFADAPTDVSKMKVDDCARARKANKTCVLDIGEENIDGSAPMGEGSAFSFRGFAKLDSLVHIRRDFIVEILKTTEDL